MKTLLVLVCLYSIHLACDLIWPFGFIALANMSKFDNRSIYFNCTVCVCPLLTQACKRCIADWPWTMLHFNYQFHFGTKTSNFFPFFPYRHEENDYMVHLAAMRTVLPKVVCHSRFFSLLFFGSLTLGWFNMNVFSNFVSVPAFS